MDSCLNGIEDIQQALWGQFGRCCPLAFHCIETSCCQQALNGRVYKSFPSFHTLVFSSPLFSIDHLCNSQAPFSAMLSLFRILFGQGSKESSGDVPLKIYDSGALQYTIDLSQMQFRSSYQAIHAELREPRNVASHICRTTHFPPGGLLLAGTLEASTSFPPALYAASRCSVVLEGGCDAGRRGC